MFIMIRSFRLICMACVACLICLRVWEICIQRQPVHQQQTLTFSVQPFHNITENLNYTKLDLSEVNKKVEAGGDQPRPTGRTEQESEFASSAGNEDLRFNTSGLTGELPMGSMNPAYKRAVEAATAKAPEVVVFEGLQDLQKLCLSIFYGPIFCSIVQNRTNPGTRENPTLVMLTFSSEELFRSSTTGTGNYLSGIYSWRLAARVLGTVDIMIHVTDAHKQFGRLILPWLAGFFPESSQPAPSSVPRPDLEQACSNFDNNPIHYMLEDIRFDLRRMAIAMIGIPEPGHAAQQFAEKYLWRNSRNSKTVNHVMQFAGPPLRFVPIYPKAHVDDAVLHFRCGDYMMSGNPRYGFMKFWDIDRHISPAARSIGIVTQPFSTENIGVQQRQYDTGAMDRCETVVMSLVEYLQERHPNAKISIHNDANETIALTYARMIMANQTIASMGTFGIFPALATFGTGYIRSPDFENEDNKYLLRPRLDIFTKNKMVLFETTYRLSSQRAQQLWGQDGKGDLILEWFRNKDME